MFPGLLIPLDIKNKRISVQYLQYKNKWRHNSSNFYLKIFPPVYHNIDSGVRQLNYAN